MQLNLKKNERLDDLQFNNLMLVQNIDLYAFTSDAVVLANFLKIKRGETAVEIGIGSGVISILATQKTNVKEIFAFEVQKELYDLAIKNVELNKINNITVYNDDIRNFKNHIIPESIDVVFSNPPYKKTSYQNVNKSKAIARHEQYLPLSDLCLTTSKILRYGGRAYFVYDADRACEMIAELKKNNLEPKKMFFTQNGRGKVILFLVEAVKGGKPGVKVYPNLITNDLNGEYLSTVKNYSLS